MTRKNKSVPIWEKDNKQWRYRFVVDGVQRNFYSNEAGKKGETECYLKAEQAKAEIQPRKDLRIGELWEEYQEYLKAEFSESSGTYQNSLSISKNHILPKCKHKRLSQMSTLDWQNIINKAKPIKRKYKTKTKTVTRTESGELSAKTLKHIRATIQGFLKWCRLGELTNLRPELSIPRNREKIERNVLTTDEAITLVRTRISNIPMLHAFRLQIVLGLRPGEVLALKMSDIDGKMMHIQRAINDKGQITGGKNHNANRHEYLFPLAAEIISDQQKYKKQKKIISHWLFPRSDGSAASQNVYRANLAQYCTEVGCTKITPYRLRHNFVSLMAGRLDLDVMKLIIGHSASMDTLGVYNQKLDDNIRLAGTAVGNVWDKVLQN